jgi:hypothetical protein
MNPDENTTLFIENFKRVRDLGFVRSHRSHNTGIGKTLEDLMGVEENNLDEPDFGNIEIKSQRNLVGSYITLFTKSPSYPKSTNTFLRDNYGIENEDNPDIKKLHTSMFCSHFNKTYEKWGFRIRPSEIEQKLFIDVKDLDNNEMEGINVYYDYSILKSILIKKLNIVAFVSTEHKTENGVEHFHFNKCKVYYKCDFENFISLIRQDKIMYDIRIGSYKTGSKYGKVHDHGSGFRVKRENMSDVFDSEIDVG